MTSYSTVFIVIATLALISYVLSRLMDSEPIIPKKPDIYDVEGVVGLAAGFTAFVAILSAIGVFGNDFYVYTRVAITLTMIIAIFYLLYFRIAISLLLIALFTTLVLFNPFELVVFSRPTWIMIDLAVAVVLPLLTYRYVKSHKERIRQENRIKRHSQNG